MGNLDPAGERDMKANDMRTRTLTHRTHARTHPHVWDYLDGKAFATSLHRAQWRAHDVCQASCERDERGHAVMVRQRNQRCPGHLHRTRSGGRSCFCGKDCIGCQPIHCQSSTQRRHAMAMHRAEDPGSPAGCLESPSRFEPARAPGRRFRVQQLNSARHAALTGAYVKVGFRADSAQACSPEGPRGRIEACMRVRSIYRISLLRV